MAISHFVARYVAWTKYKISLSLEFPTLTIKHGRIWHMEGNWRSIYLWWRTIFSVLNYCYCVYLDCCYFPFNFHFYVSIFQVHVIFFIIFLRACKVRCLYRRNRNAKYNDTNIDYSFEDYQSSFFIVNIWTWRLQSCWWHCDVGDLQLVMILECWR